MCKLLCQALVASTHSYPRRCCCCCCFCDNGLPSTLLAVRRLMSAVAVAGDRSATRYAYAAWTQLLQIHNDELLLLRLPGGGGGSLTASYPELQVCQPVWLIRVKHRRHCRHSRRRCSHRDFTVLSLRSAALPRRRASTCTALARAPWPAPRAAVLAHQQHCVLRTAAAVAAAVVAGGVSGPAGQLRALCPADHRRGQAARPKVQCSRGARAPHLARRRLHWRWRHRPSGRGPGARAGSARAAGGARQRAG